MYTELGGRHRLLPSGSSETTHSIRQAAERPHADRMCQPVRHGWQPVGPVCRPRCGVCVPLRACARRTTSTTTLGRLDRLAIHDHHRWTSCPSGMTTGLLVEDAM